jgi:hypothetical protein
MASLYDLYVEQGADFLQSIDLMGDWTNNTIDISITDSVGTICDGTIEWTDQENGTFSISLSAIQSAKITKGVGKYNVEATNLFGKVDRIIQGRIYVDGDIV